MDYEPKFQLWDDTNIPPYQFRSYWANTKMEQLRGLDYKSKALDQPEIQIACSIGPSCNSVEVLQKMMEGGMTIARLNFSHGIHEDHEETIENIREASRKYSEKFGYYYPVAIALDTRGPEIRTGVLIEEDEVDLQKGDILKLTTDRAYAEKSTRELVYIDYDNIQRVVKVNTKINIDHDLITLTVNHIQGNVLTCTVENDCVLRSKRDVNLCAVAVDLPAVTEQDKIDIQFGVEAGLDMVFCSFIRSPDAIHQIRELLGEKGRDTLIMAKIQNLQGLNKIEEVLDVCDGILVTRGKIALEISVEKTNIFQKQVIGLCARKMKSCILTTDVLGSMLNYPRPLTGDVLDVANAVLDGVDGLEMLSVTSVGMYPVESVNKISKIAREARCAIWHYQVFTDLRNRAIPPLDIVHTTALVAVETAFKLLSPAIIVITKSAKSARCVSAFKPTCPILAVVRDARVARQCRLFKAIVPLLYCEPKKANWTKDIEARIEFAITFGKVNGFIRTGDPIIVIHEWKKESGLMSTMKIVYSQNLPEPVIF